MSKIGKIRVGVLRGGPSGEYEISLKTGNAVLENLPAKYHPIDIFIDKNGIWHHHGLPYQPEKILKHLDVVFNALHGEYGEDGKVQKIFEHFKIPYTGSNSFSSALAMNKVFSRKIFGEVGLRIPEAEVLKKSEASYLKVFEIFSHLPKPIVVKPSSGGSSLGVNITDSLENFSEAIWNAFEYSEIALIERCVEGIEVTCGVIEGVNQNQIFALPPIEIRPTNSDFFDYQAKYSGTTEEICPAELPEDLIEEVKNVAILAHKALNLKHYSRTDMIIDDDDNIYVLETNTLPGLTLESLFPKSVRAAGSNLSDFLDHLLTLALKNR